MMVTVRPQLSGAAWAAFASPIQPAKVESNAINTAVLSNNLPWPGCGQRIQLFICHVYIVSELICRTIFWLRAAKGTLVLR